MKLGTLFCALFFLVLTLTLTKPVETRTSPCRADGVFAIGRTVFVLDSTPLYFGAEAQEFYGIYGFGAVNIMSGTVMADTIRAGASVFIGKNAAVTIAGEIAARGAFECYGGNLTAGAITAPRVWLDSSLAPLFVTVTGDISAGYYTQSGGEVYIGGTLRTADKSEDSHAVLSLNNEYAAHNASFLNAGGAVVRTTYLSGMDEAAYESFLTLRSDRKVGGYDKTPSGLITPTCQYSAPVRK